jgi:uncharacterized membrane protein
MSLSKIFTPKQVLLLVLLAVLLNLARILATGSYYFSYLIWNIVLAFVPFIVSGLMLWYGNSKKPFVWLLIVLGIVWLFTFPNAPYLVTDVIHLKENHIVPVWFDAMLLFSSAWAGMMLGLYSLSHIETLLRKYFSNTKTWIFLILSILLSSFGIYLGRTLRWNSWDVVMNPHNLLLDIVDIFSRPNVHGEGYMITAAFFVFITISYLAWRTSGREFGSSRVIR